MTSAAATGNDSNEKRPAAADRAPRLAYDRTGRGEPLVLLHGQGFSRRCWDPIIDMLAEDRDVIAVDLPGHGDSPRQPKSTGSAPHDLAVAVAELLDELDLPTVHVAGSSSGGWVALELGRLQRAQTVTALDPSGLPYEPVKTAIHDMATAPGFRETLHALEKRQFEDGAAITVPVTVAFGSRDRVLLPKVARRRDQLPDQTRWVTLSECGHIPMFDDPEATADLLLGARDPAIAGGLGEPVR